MQTQIFKRLITLIGLTATLLLSTSLHALNKFEIEQFYTTLAQHTLDTMFGKNKFISKANISITKQKYNVKYTKESNVKKSNVKKKEKKVYIMPGYAALKNIAPSNLNQLPYDSVTTLSESKIRKITLTIFANKSMPRSESRKIKPILRELLNLKPNRDSIKIKYKAFFDPATKPAHPIKIIGSKEDILSFKNLLFSIFTLISFLFLIAYLIKGGSKKEIKKDEEKGGKAPTINVNPNIDIPEPKSPAITVGGGEGGKSKKQYFNFITAQNIEILIRSIKKEKSNIDYISIIASYLSEDLIATLIESFDINIQIQLLEKLQEEKKINPTIIGKIEQKARIVIETTIGGEHVIKKTVKGITLDTQKNLLTHTKEKQPKLHKELRKNIKLVEDIITLKDEQINNIVSKNNIEVISKALCDEKDNIKEKIKSLLPDSGKAMITEYIKSYEKDLNQKQKDAAKKTIIEDILKLTQIEK